MKKSIAISHFWPLPENLLNKIKSTAPHHDLINLTDNPTDVQLSSVEILFGNVGMDIINKMQNLKWVHAQTAGVEMYLNPKNPLSTDIYLTNSSGAYGISIAEHMLCFTLMLLRNTPDYLRQQHDHIWKGISNSRNLHDCNVAVVGMGDIGGRYAYLCNKMGATVNGVVRTPREHKPQYVDNVYTINKICEAVKDADIIAFALPGTNETMGILSRELLSFAKKGVFILNIGRGSAIDQAALVELLQSGHVGGAALDVTSPEPLPPDSPIWDMPNVIITPHVSHGGRDNTSKLVVEKFVKNLNDYLTNKPFERVVNREAGY